VLDFGERLSVEGIDWCQRFSGFAVLNGNEIVLDEVDFDRSRCSTGDLILLCQIACGLGNPESRTDRLT
jgi:hypothetical protein